MTIDHIRETRLTRAALGLTLIATVLSGSRLAHDGAGAYGRGDALAIVEILAFAASVLFLIYGNVVYQWCRLAYHQRMHRHRPAAREDIEQNFDGDAPSLAVLVPSYKEEPRVVLQTLLSAAFAEYPQKSVVLLLDDPPRLELPEEARRRDDTRRLVAVLQTRFDPVMERYRTELAAFARRTVLDLGAELERLACLYTEASAWLTVLAQDVLSESAPTVPSHTDRFFDREIVQRAARRQLAFAQELRCRIGAHDAPSRAVLQRHYARLASLFDVRFSVFERKQYVNLSNEPNKAMNLNTYIGLMGKRWRVVERADGRHLCEASRRDADLTVPVADYLITLDADSLLLPEYALRLVHWMEQPAHARVAIAQTPYSAFPGAPTGLERAAGATTDLQ